MKKHCILIVDDEPNIRSSLTRLFQRNGYDTLLAENGEDALTLLKTRNISVVLSDYTMPGQSGVAFLKVIKQQYPGMIRMILSGRADMKTVMAAVNDGVVSHFLLKPWDNKVLLETLRQAIHELEQSAHFHHLLNAEDEVEVDENLELTYPGISTVRTARNGAIVIGN